MLAARVNVSAANRESTHHEISSGREVDAPSWPSTPQGCCPHQRARGLLNPTDAGFIAVTKKTTEPVQEPELDDIIGSGSNDPFGKIGRDLMEGLAGSDSLPNGRICFHLIDDGDSELTSSGHKSEHVASEVVRAPVLRHV